MTALKRSSLAVAALCATLLSTVPARSWCHYNVNNFGPRANPWTSVPVYVDFGAGDLRRTGLSESTVIRYVEASIAEFNAAAATTSRLYFAGIRRPADLLYYSDLPDDSGIHIRATTCAENSCCVDPDDCADDEDCDCSDPGTLCCDECVECSPHCIGGTGDAIAAKGEGKSLVRMKALQSGYAEGGLGFFVGLGDDGIETCNSFEPWDTDGGPQTTECVGDSDCSSSEECVNGVFNESKGYCIPYKDFQGVLTHELGHAMGLGHAEWNVCQCLDEDGTHSGDVVETWGVMRSREHSAWGAGKKLFRDDIEGFRSLYSPSGFPQSWSLYRWLSNQGLSWGLPALVPGSPEQSRVPPAATSASATGDGFLVLGFTDDFDYVRHYTRDAGGWHAATVSESRVDEDTQLLRPTDGQLIPAGRSFRRVAVGYAPPIQGVHPGRVMVAWIFEDDHEFKAKIRYGIRDRDDLGAGAWCYDMLTTRYRTSPGIAYDAVNERFVLSYLENNNGPGLPTLRTIDPLTCVASEPETLQPKGLAAPEGLHDIGKPVCRTIDPQVGPDRTACVIPIATTSSNGPCLGWYGGDLPNGPLDTLDPDRWERKIHCLRNFGQGDLARDPWGQEGMVGTLTHFARGADPVADLSPLCGLPGCGFTEDPEAQIFLRYKLADPSGDTVGGFVNQNGANGAPKKLATPTDFAFVPGTSALAPGQPDPSPWWPGAMGSVGTTSDRFRFYRTLGPVCGNGIVEDGESCDGGTGQTDCQDLGFEGGTLRCSSQCTWDTSDCSEIPGCTGSPGDPGCECLAVTSCPSGQVDEDGCYPDGPGSYLGPVDEDYHGDLGLYCPDNAGGNGSVCGTSKIGGQLHSVCRECPSLPASGMAGYGCPCRGDSDCAATGWSGPVTGSNTGLQVGLACWGGSGDGWSAGDGVCLPALDPAAPQTTPAPMAHHEEFERTRWLCKSTCAAIEANTGLSHQCHFNQTFEFVHASCIEESACIDTALPGQCEHEEQGRCDQVTDVCSDECDPAFNGTNPLGGNPDCQAWGYPGYWQCAAWGNPPRCVVPECVVDPLISGLDVSECRQFLHGEPGPP